MSMPFTWEQRTSTGRWEGRLGGFRVAEVNRTSQGSYRWALTVQDREGISPTLQAAIQDAARAWLREADLVPGVSYRRLVRTLTLLREAVRTGRVADAVLVLPGTLGDPEREVSRLSTVLDVALASSAHMAWTGVGA